MTLQQLLSPFRRAIDEYSMISEGDKIAIGLSGGKDSLLLVYLFSALRRFYDKKFEVVAINIDMGFKDADPEKLEGLKRECENAQIPLIVEKTDIAEIVFDVRKEASPCSLCSKMRRGALNTVALREGCNKLALGHHADDVIETFLLSLFYEGRISSFQPMSEMSRTGITVIRPLIYTDEKNVTAFMKDKPILKNPCPADKHTQREYVKNLIRSIQDDIPFIKKRMLGAVTHPERINLSGYLTEEKINAKKQSEEQKD